MSGHPPPPEAHRPTAQLLDHHYDNPSFVPEVQPRIPQSQANPVTDIPPPKSNNGGLFRAREKYGPPGHQRYGLGKDYVPRYRTDYGHNRYGIKMDSNGNPIPRRVDPFGGISHSFKIFLK